MKRVRNKQYNYQQYTITFDLDYTEEKEMVEWIKKHKAKKNSINKMLKDGLKLLMAGGGTK